MDDRREGTWRENGWLLLLGLVALAAPLALGPERFALLLGPVLESNPVELRLRPTPSVLRAVVPLVGAAALAAFLAAGLRHRSALDWAFGPLRSRSERWRALLVSLALVNAFTFLTVRFVQEAERAWAVRGIPMRERSWRGYYQGRFDARRAEHFLARARARGGNLVILRNSGGGEPGGFLRLEHLQYSAHLFPVRVFLVRAPRCDVADLPEEWLAERSIRWVARDCVDSFVFAPAPLAGGRAP